MTKIYGPLALTALAPLLATAPTTHAFAAAPHPLKCSSSFPSTKSKVVKNQQRNTLLLQSPFVSKQQPPLFSSSSSTDPYASPQLDTDAILKYGVSAITELTLFACTFKFLDVAFTQLANNNIIAGGGVPFPVAFAIFYACSLKSRVFNPLNNQRPDRSKAIQGKEGSAGFRDRIMPSWTPPGVVFPIMWLLIIGPIRAYSSALIATNIGFFSIPIMAFMLHLTVGDIWNTVNNTEKRYGASVVGVLCVVLSAANAANQYYIIDQFAGKLLGLTLIWLVTAAALITDTWRLNPINGNEKKLVPLFPVKGEAETKFIWFAKKE
jgi:tryptophan-rich sensory protein